MFCMAVAKRRVLHSSVTYTDSVIKVWMYYTPFVLNNTNSFVAKLASLLWAHNTDHSLYKTKLQNKLLLKYYNLYRNNFSNVGLQI